MQVSNEIVNRNSVDNLVERVRMYADAGTGLIYIKTPEIMRGLSVIRNCILSDGHKYKEWDVLNGTREFTIQNINDKVSSQDMPDTFIDSFCGLYKQLFAPSKNPKQDLVVEETDSYIYNIYVSPKPWAEMPPVVFAINGLVANLPTTNHRVILIGTESLPDVVEENVTVVHMESPGIPELSDSLTSILSGIVNDSGGDMQLEFEESEIDQLAQSGAGMSSNYFEQAASMAIVHASMTDEEIKPDDVSRYIIDAKTEIVNQNELLELYKTEDINDVGGLDNLKNWIEKRKHCYTDEAIEFGIESPKGLVFVGVPGCLSWDTKISISRAEHARQETIESLYYRFNGKHKEGVDKGVIGKYAKEWDATIPTKAYCYKEADGYIGTNTIEGVVYSGEKRVFEVTTDFGQKIKTTTDHKFLTPDGYKKLFDVKIGDKVFTQGKGDPIDSNSGRNKNIALLQINNVGNHPNARTRYTKNLSYTSHPLHRLVYESEMNHMSLPEFLYALHGDVSELSFLESNTEVHHVDNNRLNNTPINLAAMSKAEHARIHTTENNMNKYQYAPRLQTVKRVDWVGVVPTYDIQMSAPDHNFVANGFVVHNSGKSLTAKAVAGVLGIPCVRLDFGKVFNSLVGKSEEQIRKALRMIESMSPCVCLVDEIDKGLGGASGASGDSGVSSRVLGTFLTWLQDNPYPVFTMVTANNVTGLPPELLRKGRFDATFATGLPTIKERLQVLDIHLRKRGHDIKSFKKTELTTFAKASEGYVPAEIEAGIKESLVIAFDDAMEAGETPELTMDNILKAMDDMVPLSKSHKEDMDAILEWSRKNATPASLPEKKARQAKSVPDKKVTRIRKPKFAKDKE